MLKRCVGLLCLVDSGLRWNDLRMTRNGGEFHWRDSGCAREPTSDNVVER